MSGNANLDSAAATDRLLSALSEQLSLTRHEYDLIVIGGSALLALGLVSCSTQDVDEHFSDLRALEPSGAELLSAARWTRTHDPSEDFLSVLTEVLAYFKVDDADLGA
jgi:hypothetical protein